MSSVPLTRAVTSGDASAVSAVLANGADVNERTGGGQTPLILATIFGHTHLIPLLLEAGADPQLRDNLGLNAIDWAQRRGATEAFAVLTNKPSRRSATATRVEPRPPAPATRNSAPRAQDNDKSKPISPEEKSQRWLAGLKQRIAELPPQDVAEGRNIFMRLPEPEMPELPEPTPEIPEVPTPEPDLPGPPPELPKPPPPAIPEPEPESPAEPVTPEPQTKIQPEPQVAAVAPAGEQQVARPRSARKRCPKCNAVYNSELVAYCAHHFVALVDADEPPIISEPASASPMLFWMIIVITLTGSVAIGSLITAYFYNSSTAAPQTTNTPAAPTAVQKGTPVVGRELEGKVVSLPIAECPLNGQEAIPGTVVVRVTIDKSGQVKAARASGGDWLLRGAATEAAMKSTFSPQKLRSRETEGTITYTFEP